MSDEVKVTLTLDDKKARSSIEQVTKSFDDFGKKAVESLTNSNSMLEKITENGLAFAVGETIFESVSSAISGMNQFLSDSVHAFSEQEDALNRMAQALRVTNSYSDTTMQALSDFSSELQANSKFADEAVLAQVAFVKSLGATTEQSKNLVLAAANLSATIGGSLEENVDKLGKTLSGTAGRLGQYIPELKALTEEQLRNGAAADIINQKYSGAAANDLKTYSGSIQATKNAFSDLQEEIGQLIAKNPITVSAIESAKKTFEDLGSSIKSVNSVLSGDNSLLKTQATASGAAVQVEMLNKEIEKLKLKIADEESKEAIDNGLLGYSRSNAVALNGELERLISKRNQVEEALTYNKFKGAEIKETGKPKSDEEIATEKAKQAEISYIKQQGYQADIEQRKLYNTQISLDDEVRAVDEINRVRDQEIAKINLKTDFDIQTANAKLKGTEKELELQKINADKELKIKQATYTAESKLLEQSTKVRQKNIDEEKKLLKEREANQKDTFSTIATLSSQNNKTLAAIGKAAGITQIAIDTPIAISKALAAFPPPFNFAAAALVGTAMAVQAANIAGVKFESGGFVPGLSQFGDQVQARLNPNEVVLNSYQQKQFMDIANGRSNTSSSSDLSSLISAIQNQVITINIDGREIARTIRDQKLSGFSI